ncbi:MAG: glycosyltransferase [Acidiferrobacterales bacterium]|nr:glycosyltransferase [Acidiferrobacterales bacterium]
MPVTQNPAQSTRVLLVGDHRSTHIRNWKEHLSNSGIQVECIYPRNSRGISGFLHQLIATRRAIKHFHPDIVHYHYASRYGLIGLLTPFGKRVISVWGSDITIFPKKSLLHSTLIKMVLHKGDAILATSEFLKAETLKYCQSAVTVTPFGIDTKRFSPSQSDEPLDSIRIGCIKSFREIYGIRDLIEAYSIVTNALPEHRLKLIIAGAGHARFDAEKLLGEFKIDPATVELLPAIDHSEVHKLHQSLDIAVYPSLQEGYGVAALESSACGVPVIASNIGGHKEVVVHEKTGLHTPPAAPDVLAKSILRLVNNPEMRTELGKQGRLFVKSNYSISTAVEIMCSVYSRLLNKDLPRGVV